MFWLIGTAFALRNFLTLTTLGGFTRVFRETHDLLVFGGVWALTEIPGPNRQKKLTPQKSKKVGKMRFHQKQSDFFRFRPLVPPRGAVRTEKTWPFSVDRKNSDPKKSENMLKILLLLRFQKMCLRRKRSDFHVFFRFRPLVPPYRGAH